ncbi:odorant receptor 85f-like [Harpegnathos saltator]|uniref:odorant receptor 85f-like n=1 Tax=Harpegnathos saltator TaxID=610380 RepID=UPI00058C6EFA|nr:odorant receptor 85f-like [Harpegnathos saltator]
MFEANLCGQEVIDHNRNLFHAVYNVYWYITPLSIQKLIILLLQRGNKPFFLNVGGLFIMSLENFAMLLSASISYFTVIYSTQINEK